VLERAEAIEGWMTPPELAFLQALVLTLPFGSTVVELGSWKGRSTVAICEALASREARAVAVDTFSGDNLRAGAFDQSMLDVFRANTASFDFLETVVGDSAESAGRFPDASVDLVFVDADHSYDAVRRDIRAWAPKLRPGGLLSGHDWGWIGVSVAVREAFGRVGLFESIWYTRKRPGLHPLATAERYARRIYGAARAGEHGGLRA
jgi:predicted O-methyltransferase YrrM